MKTPVQEVFAHLRALGKIYNDDWLLEMEKATLEKEKEVIVLAHINGQSEFDNGAYRQKVIGNAEHYYNETFNTKEK